VVGGGKGFLSEMDPLSSTEIYDDLTSGWRSGPELPIGIVLGVLVEDQHGGVVLIGGHHSTLSNKTAYLDTMYWLKHAGNDKTILNCKNS
jgi:hypothetical protein